MCQAAVYLQLGRQVPGRFLRQGILLALPLLQPGLLPAHFVPLLLRLPLLRARSSMAGLQALQALRLARHSRLNSGTVDWLRCAALQCA